MILIIGIIVIMCLYWYFPIRVKIILYVINMFIPDPIPLIDEILMLVMIYKNYLRIRRWW